MRNIRPARTAELVADTLRAEIVDGRIADALPKEDELRDRFGVSKASMREALLILETEGLISVRRGKVGGSVVHLPTPGHAAYTLGLVLGAQKVGVAEVGAALQVLEPQCAVLCARRRDRRRTVVAELERINAEMVANLDDGVSAVARSREFHEAIVAGCDNQALTLVTGALERLWSAHEQEWAQAAQAEGSFPSMRARRRAAEEHDEVVARIRAGDESVADVLAAHLRTSQRYPDPDRSPRVDVSALRAELSRRP